MCYMGLQCKQNFYICMHVKHAFTCIYMQVRAYTCKYKYYMQNSWTLHFWKWRMLKIAPGAAATATGTAALAGVQTHTTSFNTKG